MNSIQSFLPKVFFPGSIYIGNKAPLFFQIIKEKKKAVLISKSAYKRNEKIIEELGVISELILHHGEPTVKEADKIKEKVFSTSCEYLIAIGGGSIIDLAKYTKLKLDIKLVAVPTTIGSGSEVSQFAVFIKNKQKKVISSNEMLPDTIILSPKFLDSLTDNQIIIQSLDALSHSLEALVSRISNPLSDMLSLISFEVIYNSLRDLKNNRQLSLENIQIAATLAGMAQSSAATGLIHSFAHCLGPKYNLSHAQAVSIFLIPVLEFNLANTEKYIKINTLSVISSSNLLKKIKDLYQKLSITTKFRMKDNLEEVAEEIKKDVCTLSNPFTPTSQQIQEVLQRYYGK